MEDHVASLGDADARGREAAGAVPDEVLDEAQAAGKRAAAHPASIAKIAGQSARAMASPQRICPDAGP